MKTFLIVWGLESKNLKLLETRTVYFLIWFLSQFHYFFSLYLFVAVERVTLCLLLKGNSQLSCKNVFVAISVDSI